MPSLDDLFFDLESTDTELRESATHALATERKKTQRILARLEGIATGDRPGDRIAAVNVLQDALSGVTRGQGYSKQACQLLWKLLRTGPEVTRAAAFRALASAADAEVQNETLVEAGLEDSTVEVLVQACNQARPFCPEDTLDLTKRAEHRLMALLGHPEARVRAAALAAIIFAPHLTRAMPLLLDSLAAGDPDIAVRDTATALMARLARSTLPHRFHLTGAGRTDSVVEPYDDPEAYKVYAAVLKTGWAWNRVHAESLVIVLETSAEKTAPEPDSGSSALMNPAISEYRRLNEMPKLLQREFPIDKAYVLLPRAQLDRLRCSRVRNFWKAFYLRYPHSGGYIALSAVGFNKDRSVAVVFMASLYGMLGGEGSFYVLGKRDRKWELLPGKGKHTVWMI